MPEPIERTEDRLSRVPETALNKRAPFIGGFRPTMELLEREHVRLPLLVWEVTRRIFARLFFVRVADVTK
jgi:hypothetical protein